jgi:glycosyltransferase involved in cell wall biosynthesis
MSSIIKYGYPIENIHYCPNWADIDSETLSSEEIEALPVLPNGFVILFTGNIGDAQDFETIIRCASETKLNKDIKWVFIGDGRKRLWLENEIISRNLSDTVFWLGRFPFNTMPYFYQKASVLLVSLKPNPAFELTVPAKLQNYMANKKPILSMLSGAGNEIVNEACCGIGVESGDYKSLAIAAEKFRNYPKVQLEFMGTKGYDYFIGNFEKEKVLGYLNSILINEVNNHS